MKAFPKPLPRIETCTVGPVCAVQRVKLDVRAYAAVIMVNDLNQACFVRLKHFPSTVKKVHRGQMFAYTCLFYALKELYSPSLVARSQIISVE